MARNKGFSIVEIFIVILVVALVAFIGWKVWDTMNTPKADSTSQTTTKTDAIKSNADLDTANKTLDSVPVDDSDLKQLNAEASF